MAIMSQIDNILTKILPESLTNYLRKFRFENTLKKPYINQDYDFKNMPKASLKSNYALSTEKDSSEYIAIMNKLESYIGAGPFGPNKYWEYPWVLTNLDFKPEMKILDAGCGRAPLQYFLAEAGVIVSGIDPNEGVGWHGIDRRLAKKYNLDIDYRVEGMEKISYENNTFDRVLNVSVIEHCRANAVKNETETAHSKEDLALQASMMQEMKRVLKPGGLLVLTTDLNFPDNNLIAESNMNVQNLIENSGMKLIGRVAGSNFYGEEYFSFEETESIDNIDIQKYFGIKASSIGLIFKK